MTTWLLPPRSGATFTTPSGNVITATLARPTPFTDSDVPAALAQGWTYSDTAPLPPLGDLLPVQFTSGLIQYPYSAPLATGTPNITLTNAIGTTETQFAFITIKGGALGPSSQLDIRSTYSKLLDTVCNILVKIGPASGSYASASYIGGQFGLTTQRSIGHLHEVWNTGTLNNQLSNGSGNSNAVGITTATLTSTSIDTALDWNIYFAMQYTAAPVVGDSVTLRKFRVEIKN